MIGVERLVPPHQQRRAVERDHTAMDTAQLQPSPRTHIDINDRAARAALAARLRVTEEQLRKTVRLVGTRVRTIEAHHQA
ncbi:DUF3606 domain-containing protein [Methylobacterium sp. J-077]|uniref:DUF3606 domain-containing protein n=2 Tax=unclassified Methylobacterium TaxID=2615210 RepID=UPI0028C4203D|nr:DUF3606 domain-containing protein [Methylobacterium sp. J-077]